MRRPLHELCGVAGGHVVGARQVIIGDVGVVKRCVSILCVANFVRRLVERRAHIEMRTGNDPLGRTFWEACLSANGTVFLLIGLIEALSREVLVSNVTETVWNIGQFLQHAEDFSAMYRWDSCFSCWCRWRIVQGGEEF